jgi:glycosyl transferase family 25
MNVARTSAPTFVIINLARDIERFQLLQKELDARSFHYVRIEGVDGRKLKESTGPEIVPVRASKRFPRGLLVKDQGLTMSHRKAALHILQQNLPHGIILEDDVNFSPDFKSLVTEVCAEQPADIVKFEGIGQQAYTFIHRSIGNRKLVTPLLPTMGAACYFLNRRAAECIVDLTSTAWGPADHVLAKAMQLVKSFHILPYPAFQRPELAVYHPGTAEMNATRLGVFIKARREASRYASHCSHLMSNIRRRELSFDRFERLNLQDEKSDLAQTNEL